MRSHDGNGAVAMRWSAVSIHGGRWQLFHATSLKLTIPFVTSARVTEWSVGSDISLVRAWSRKFVDASGVNSVQLCDTFPSSERS